MRKLSEQEILLIDKNLKSLKKDLEILYGDSKILNYHINEYIDIQAKKQHYEMENNLKRVENQIKQINITINELERQKKEGVEPKKEE